MVYDSLELAHLKRLHVHSRPAPPRPLTPRRIAPPGPPPLPPTRGPRAGGRHGVLVRSTHTATLLAHHVADLVLKFHCDVVVLSDLVTRRTDLPHHSVHEFGMVPSRPKGFRRFEKEEFTRKMSTRAPP